MNANVLQVNRKRASSGEAPQEQQFVHYDLPKRNKILSDVDAIEMIPAANAWPIDMSEIITGLAQAQHSGTDGYVFNNMGRYDPNTSVFVICVRGFQNVHYELLCSTIERLVALSPSVQILALNGCEERTRGERTRAQQSTASLPEISDPGFVHKYFLKLGLLNPLGGGRDPLDAIVVLDAAHRRRLILPFGWGAGRHIFDAAGGDLVIGRLMNALEDGLMELRSELRR